MESKNIKRTNIIDNQIIKLGDIIKKNIKNSVENKFAVGYFFLSGWNIVENDFRDDLDGNILKLVMGDETNNQTKQEIIKGFSLREKYLNKFAQELETEISIDKATFIKSLSNLIATKKIDIRLYDKEKLHAKLYLFIQNKEFFDDSSYTPGSAIVGSSNFTKPGFMDNRELNVNINNKDDIIYLNEWFEQLWNESNEFNQELLKVIENSKILENIEDNFNFGEYLDVKDYFKYILYNVFEKNTNFLNEESDYLATFQEVGVLNILEKIKQFNGALVADSVGLGKSYIAGEVIKKFIEGFDFNESDKFNRVYNFDFNSSRNVLMLLPPHLIKQWKEDVLKDFFLKKYRIEFDIELENEVLISVYTIDNRIISKIKLLSISKFTNLRASEVDKLRDEFDLICIDEAHRIRNNKSIAYKKVLGGILPTKIIVNGKKRIIKEKFEGLKFKSDSYVKNINSLKDDEFKNKSIRNRFLLLTATPLNNTIEDLENLLRIFLDPDNKDFDGEFDLNLFNQYSAKRNLYKKVKDNKADGNIEDLKKESKEIVLKLKRAVLDKVILLRTRKYIQNNEEFKNTKINGKAIIFKDAKPIQKTYEEYLKLEKFQRYKELVDYFSKEIEDIQFYHITLGGSEYVFLRKFESGDYDINLGNDGSYKEDLGIVRVQALMKILMLKRLESSIYSFSKTLSKIIEKEKYLYHILRDEKNSKKALESYLDKFEDSFQGGFFVEKDDETGEIEEVIDDINSDELEYQTRRDRYFKNAKKNMDSLGRDEVLKKLKEDIDKLERLQFFVTELKEKKDLQFKDPKIEDMKTLIKKINSKSRNKILLFTQYKDTAYYLFENLKDWTKKELNINSDIITGDTETITKKNKIGRFAPIANHNTSKKIEDIDLLIATDALSEGVNMQDASVLINYDLPWNPMIIVQRIGRVNRIGSEKDIEFYNYLPVEGIEVIVGLKKKIEDKIELIQDILEKEQQILKEDEETGSNAIGELYNSSVTDLEEKTKSSDFEGLDELGTKSGDGLFSLLTYSKESKKKGLLDFNFNKISNLNEDSLYYTLINKDSNKIIRFYKILNKYSHQVKKKYVLVYDLNTKTINLGNYSDLIINLERESMRISFSQNSDVIKKAIKEMDLIFENEYYKYYKENFKPLKIDKLRDKSPRQIEIEGILNHKSLISNKDIVKVKKKALKLLKEFTLNRNEISQINKIIEHKYSSNTEEDTLKRFEAVLYQIEDFKLGRSKEGFEKANDIIYKSVSWGGV
ncbi:MAG: helicase-related protein [Candidatus Nanoarchaeia archaeon]